MHTTTGERGISILGIIFLGILIILALSYFNISIRAVVESPETQGNFNYVANIGRTIWHDYLREPFFHFFSLTKQIAQSLLDGSR